MKLNIKTLFIPAVIVCILGVAVYIWQIGDSPPPPSETPAPLVETEAPVPDEGPSLTEEEIAGLPRMARAAWGQGLKRCVGKLASIDKGLLEVAPSGSMKLSKEGNTLVLLNEITTVNNALYLSVTAAEDAANDTCHVTYDLVSYNPQPCSQVKETRFADYALNGHLHEKLYILSAAGEAAGSQKLVLMPLGNACVSISKRYL